MLKNFYLIISVLIASFCLAEKDDKHIFSDIYKNDTWCGGSGSGSVPKNAMPYLELLQKFFNDKRFNTIVDLGCGDWQLMERIIIPRKKSYMGYDVVQEVIDANNKRFAKPNVQFITINSLQEIEHVRADLLIVKDVLAHWPNSRVQYFLTKILPNYKYALITHDVTDDFGKEDMKNSDIKLGSHRPIDITLEPFNLKNTTVVLKYNSLGYDKISFFYENPIW
ncbi:class I SAM-dependent methyltransferase [Candidatus Phycorickettsia trachydisci]|nr:class I SAM-dependent methyltransferase [Candidatus Phycorickettsia trachydisci]